MKWLDPAAVHEGVEARSLLVIDVRSPTDHAGGHIPRSTSLPGRAIASVWNKVPTGRTLLFVDDDGSQVEAACALAEAAGRSDVAGLRGGFEAWLEAGHPVATLSDGLTPLDEA